MGASAGSLEGDHHDVDFCNPASRVRRRRSILDYNVFSETDQARARSVPPSAAQIKRIDHSFWNLDALPPPEYRPSVSQRQRDLLPPPRSSPFAPREEAHKDTVVMTQLPANPPWKTNENGASSTSCSLERSPPPLLAQLQRQLQQQTPQDCLSPQDLMGYGNAAAVGSKSEPRVEPVPASLTWPRPLPLIGESLNLGPGVAGSPQAIGFCGLPAVGACVGVLGSGLQLNSLSTSWPQASSSPIAPAHGGFSPCAVGMLSPYSAAIPMEVPVVSQSSIVSAQAGSEPVQPEELADMSRRVASVMNQYQSIIAQRSGAAHSPTALEQHDQLAHSLLEAEDDFARMGFRWQRLQEELEVARGLVAGDCDSSSVDECATRLSRSHASSSRAVPVHVSVSPPKRETRKRSPTRGSPRRHNGCHSRSVPPFERLDFADMRTGASDDRPGTSADVGLHPAMARAYEDLDFMRQQHKRHGQPQLLQQISSCSDPPQAAQLQLEWPAVSERWSVTELDYTSPNQVHQPLQEHRRQHLALPAPLESSPDDESIPVLASGSEASPVGRFSAYSVSPSDQTASAFAPPGDEAHSAAQHITTAASSSQAANASPRSGPSAVAAILAAASGPRRGNTEAILEAVEVVTTPRQSSVVEEHEHGSKSAVPVDQSSRNDLPELPAPSVENEQVSGDILDETGDARTGPFPMESALLILGSPTEDSPIVSSLEEASLGAETRPLRELEATQTRAVGDERERRKTLEMSAARRERSTSMTFVPGHPEPERTARAAQRKSLTQDSNLRRDHLHQALQKETPSHETTFTPTTAASPSLHSPHEGFASSRDMNVSVLTEDAIRLDSQVDANCSALEAMMARMDEERSQRASPAGDQTLRPRGWNVQPVPHDAHAHYPRSPAHNLAAKGDRSLRSGCSPSGAAPRAKPQKPRGSSRTRARSRGNGEHLSSLLHSEPWANGHADALLSKARVR